MRRSFAAILAPLFLACGGSHSVGGGTGGIPDPGTSDQVDIDFMSVPPNITPEEATPLGISKNGDLVIWVGRNAIGGSDTPANYFVFQSAPESGTLQFNMCYTPAVTGMTAGLWQVVNATQVTPPIATWTISSTCGQSFSAPLDGDSVYLFGVQATGGIGTYTA